MSLSVFPLERRRRTQFEAQVLAFIDSLADEYVSDEQERVLLKKSQSEGYKLGNYIIDQIPYAGLGDIDFPPLPTDENGDLDPTGETEEVQKYGPLLPNWTGNPYIDPTSSDAAKVKGYEGTPVGFPVPFGKKRYPNEGFLTWFFHNGLKAIRFEYRVFRSRPFGKPAHIIVTYSGGDH
jgi:hypothetical protein